MQTDRNVFQAPQAGLSSPARTISSEAIATLAKIGNHTGPITLTQEEILHLVADWSQGARWVAELKEH